MEALKRIFGDRVSFDENELLLHTSDVGIMPDILGLGIIDLMIDRMPMAVVQPRELKEVVALMEFANRERIPVTPRGAATGGVGGAVPAKGGIVVNLCRMNRILEVDRKGMTVTVEPGLIWSDLDRALHAEGLMCRTIPSSAPSSTVGGWVASGGVGYGSFEFGPVDDNILSVELVLPGGEVREMGGTGLELVLGCYGATGIVTKVKLRVKEAEPIVPVEMGFPTRKEMLSALQELAKTVPMWTCNFETEEYITLKRLSQGHGTEEMANAILLGIPKGRYDPAVFKQIAEKNRGVVREQAEEAWAGRYLPLRIKKLGPSIVVGEVLIPLSRLEGFLDAFYKKLKGEVFGIEGTLTNRREAAVRLFVLTDEREVFGLNYLGEWSLPLTMLKVAKRYGGRTYQTGLFLGMETRSYFGKERLKWIFAFKRVIDPHGIMNPGKIVPLYRYSMMFGFAGPFLGLMKTKVDRTIQAPEKEMGWLSDYYAHIQSCISCGYCRSECPIYEQVGWESATSKGKMMYAKMMVQLKADVDPYIVRRFFQCTLCGHCREVCQAELPTCDIWANMRLKLMELGYPPMEAFPQMMESVHSNGNPFLEPRSKRTEVLPPDAKGLLRPGVEGKADLLLWMGCIGSYQDLQTVPGLMKVLDAAGLKYRVLGEDEGCCGSVAHISGMPGFEELANGAKSRILATGVDLVVTPCAGCANSFKNIYKKHGIDIGVRVLHAVEYIDELIRDGRLKLTKPQDLTVTYHDPCEVGRHLKIYEPPRNIIRAIPGVRFVELPKNRADSRCCGGGGGLKAVELEMSQNIAYNRILEVIGTGADTLVSACPTCKGNLKLAADRARKEKKGKVRVMDLGELVTKSLG